MRLISILLGCVILVFLASPVNADLLLSPTRVIFGPRERTKKVILKNTSTQQKSYRVFFKNLQMDESGLYYEADPSQTPNYAGTLIRFSPRLITIKPQQTQTIRLFLRRKSDMNLTEYRSHLAFKEVPPEDYGNQIGAEAGESSVKLITLFEITIPVLVKNGAEDYNVTIDGLEIIKNDTAIMLRAVFNRTGDTSSYGDILVKYKGEDSAEYQTIGQINRFFVYYPGSKRQVEIRLDLPDSVIPEKGIMQIYYNRLQSDGGDLIAFSSLNLN